MTTRTRSPVRLSDPGELLAAVPHLLGFTPVESVVVIALDARTPPGVALTLRVDLPPPEAYDALAECLLPPLLNNGATTVCLAVIAAGPCPLPHAELLVALRGVFGEAGLTVVHAVWAAAITAGEVWRCYDDSSCHGTLGDPHSSVLAATSAASGQITYGSREQFAAQLAPVADAVLARRSGLLDAAVHAPPATADSIALLRAAVRDARSGALPDTDQQIVALAVALSDRRARDACLGYTDDADVAAAERLWTLLVRETPAPERAEPATLVAFLAYLRGDGALAGVALDIASAALPGHQLAGLLRTVLEHGVQPDLLRQLSLSAADDAVHGAAGDAERP